jgi:FtsP/CotA-like multicopper oxidase with cupredoxin domain
VALAIQDRFFKKNGEFLYPAFPGDPGYDDFITCRGVKLTAPQFPHCATVPETECNDGEVVDEGNNCGPTALTEFFGDHMVVNGKIWPRMDVEPRHYRLRLLNGCDSRFLALEFCIASEGDPKNCKDDNRIPFIVIGGDQGLASNSTQVETLLMETGSRYDIILNFQTYADKRIIMMNIGGDVPFGGDLPGESNPNFAFTNLIMAFDVGAGEVQGDKFNLTALDEELGVIAAARTPLGQPDYIRKVALFEGTDEFGRYVCIHRREC